MTLINSDTICAIATSHGVGSISIIRVSGPNSLQIAKKLTKKSYFAPRYATLSSIYDSQNNLIDKILVIYFNSPHSFTGEDIIEFQCHGGIIIANMIMREILKLDVRTARAGEFSKRAFLNGKIDLTQANAIAQMIDAKSEEAIKVLNRVLRGDLKEYIDNIRNSLIEIIAHIEVSIDYAEDDLPSNILSKITKKINATIESLQNTLISSKNRTTILDGYKLSIIGKPNVGKSSLLNALLKYERAIVSDIEGTTRDTVEESLHIGTHLVKIIDTAGIRDTDDAIESIGVERSIEAIKNSDIVLAMFDGSKILDNRDKKILKLLHASDKKIIAIINKSDLKQKITADSLMLNNILLTSTKQSIDLVLKAISLNLDNSSNLDDTILISNIQEDAVKNTLNSLKNALNLITQDELEILSYELNSAIESISSISRPYEYSNMLDVMFGEFCLGK